MLSLGADIGVAVAFGVALAALVIVGIMVGAIAYLRRRQSVLETRFPTPPEQETGAAARPEAPSTADH
jgi:hypothetical protein